MPRPAPDTKLRRLLMQSIMWIILCATVGAAALVDHMKRNSTRMRLGEPVQLDGFSMRLPRGWRKLDAGGSSGAVLSLRDPKLGDVLLISVSRPSLTDLLGFGGVRGGPIGAGRVIGKVSFGEVQSDLVLQQFEEDADGTMNQLSVTRSLPPARTLSITLLSYSQDDPQDIRRETEIIRQIAESVRVNRSDGR